jgi:hypothetical protein
MATDSRALTQLAIINVTVGGIALLGWLAMAFLAIFNQLPHDWPEKLGFVSDLVFLVILLCGPACLTAGIGLLKRRGWARFVTMGLGGAAGILAITGFALACFGVLRTSAPADFCLFVPFAAYSVAVFVVLWKAPRSIG